METLFRKYTTQFDLGHKLLAPLKEILDKCSILQIQKRVLSLLDQILCSQKQNIQFWENDMCPYLFKVVFTETSDLIPETFALLCSIIRFVNPKLVFSPEIAQVAKSRYFYEAKFCCQEAISLVTELHNVFINNDVPFNLLDKSNLVQWMLHWLKFPSLEDSCNIAIRLLAQSMLNILFQTSLFYKNDNNPLTNSQIDKQIEVSPVIANLNLAMAAGINKLSQLQQPFNPPMFSRFFQHSDNITTKQSNPSLPQVTLNTIIFTELKAQVNDFCSNLSNTAITSPDNKRNRRIEATDILAQCQNELFFIEFLLTLLHMWPTAMDTSSCLLFQQAFCKILQHLAKNLMELKSNPQHWVLFIQQLLQLFNMSADVSFYPSIINLKSNDAYTNAWGSIKDKILGFLKSHMEGNDKQQHFSQRSNSSTSELIDENQDDELNQMDMNDIYVRKAKSTILEVLPWFSKLFNFHVDIQKELLEMFEKENMALKLEVLDSLTDLADISSKEIVIQKMKFLLEKQSDTIVRVVILRAVTRLMLSLVYDSSNENEERKNMLLGELSSIMTAFNGLITKRQNTSDSIRLSYLQALYTAIKHWPIVFKDLELQFEANIEDNNYWTRLFIANVAGNLGATLDHSLLATVKPLLPTTQLEQRDDELKNRTYLITLCNLAPNPDLFHSILTSLLKLASVPTFTDRKFLSQCLHYIALRCGYPSTATMISSNLRSLFFLWCKQEENESIIRSFSVEFIGQPNFTEFVIAYGNIIFPLIYETGNEKLIATFSNLVKEKAEVKFFSSIYAYTFMLRLKEVSVTKPFSLFKESLSSKQFDAILTEETDHIVFEMLSLARISHIQEPFFSIEIVRRALEQFVMDTSKLESIPKFFKNSKKRIYTLVLEFHECLENALERHQRELFDVFQEFVISFLCDNLYLESVLRSILHVVLVMTQKPKIQDAACMLLHTIIKNTNANMDGSKELCKHLNKIVKAMASLLPLADQPVPLVYDSPPYKVLALLLVNTPRTLTSAINQIDALPNYPALSEFNKALKKSIVNVSIFEDIGQLLSKTQEEFEITGLFKLSNRIRESKSSMLREMEQDLPKKRLVTTLMLRLVHLCTGQYNDTIRNEAALCLSELGLCATSAEFIPDFDVTESYREFEFDILKNRLSSCEWTSEGVLEIGKISILELLNNYLVEPNIQIIKLAVRTLQSILCTESGKKAYSKLDEETKLYLQPFSKQLPTKKNTFESMQVDNFEVDSLTDELFSTNNKNHDEWVCSVTSHLIHCDSVKDEVIKQCARMCSVKATFAEHLLPLVLFNISQYDHTKYCNRLATLLETHVLRNKLSNPRTVRLLLSTLILLLRNTRENIKKEGAPKKKKSIPARNIDYWLPMKSTLIAQAALRAGAYHTAHLFVEMHYENDYFLTPMSSSDMCFEDDALIQQTLLLDIYRNVDDPDGIYGININYGMHSQITKYRHESEWDKALGNYDVLLSTRNSKPLLDDELYQLQSGLLDVLQNLGQSHTVNSYIKTISPDVFAKSEELQERLFENAWRNCKWDISEVHVDMMGCSDRFHKTIYKCLKALNMGDVHAFQASHEACWNRITKALCSTISGYQHNLAKFQMLSELAGAWKLRWGTNPLCSNNDLVVQTSSSSSSLLLQQQPSKPHVPQDKDILWIGSAGISGHTFTIIEPVLAMRGVLLEIMSRPDLQKLHITQMASMARSENHLRLASNLIHTVYLKDKENSSVPHWLIEEAKILWKQGEKDAAINTIKFFIKKSRENNHSTEQLSLANVKLGEWLAQNQSESKDIILLHLDPKTKNYPRKSKAFFAFAKFNDSLYTNLQRKMKSQEWQIAQTIREENLKLLNEYKELMKQQSKNPHDEVKRAHNSLARVCQRDKQEEEKVTSDMREYLCVSMENYGLAAQHDDKYNIPVVFRVCSLWFNNSNDEKINTIFEKLYKDKKIGIHKFIPLIYQVASRIGSPNVKFNQILLGLLEVIATTHPFHSLYQIFALKNGDQTSAKNENETSFYIVDKVKVNGSTELLAKIRSSGKRITVMDIGGAKRQFSLKQIVDQMECLINAYKELAFWQIDKTKRGLSSLTLDDKMLISQISKLDAIPVATMALPIQADAQYSFASVDKFEKTIRFAGGINLPKIINCCGSNGQPYKQLVKGRDDLRQDAVMEQIFELVNTLLSENKDTRKRSLRLRTYKIIPLTPNSGLLQWVSDTIPLSEYLVGTHKNHTVGAHFRYRPDDWLSIDCRKKMEVAQTQKLQVLRAYNDICQKFKPVMHQFFVEKFPNPSDWFTRRLAYTRSVAVNSIVGYIIGLGDRHGYNILMDEKTAEVVHIDLGVAFEQGKLLPTPERVPFRLTRDVVDGFGIQGIEGAFRHCAESTMKVLRHNIDLLVTIVEVFIHDPLYRWNLSPLKAFKIQKPSADDDDDESMHRNSSQDSKSLGALSDGPRPMVDIKNLDAEYALLRITEKLQGYEEGELLGIKGHVNKLFSQAMDPSILSCMFYGWASWI